MTTTARQGKIKDDRCKTTTATRGENQANQCKTTAAIKQQKSNDATAIRSCKIRKNQAKRTRFKTRFRPPQDASPQDQKITKIEQNEVESKRGSVLARRITPRRALRQAKSTKSKTVKSQPATGTATQARDDKNQKNQANQSQAKTRFRPRQTNERHSKEDYEIKGNQENTSDAMAPKTTKIKENQVMSERDPILSPRINPPRQRLR
jgi:hypothetical protein